MSAREILDRAKAMGLVLQIEGDSLLCSPADGVPEDLLAEIREHKAQIMALLVAPAALQVGEQEVHGSGLIRCTAEGRYEIEDAFGRLHGIRHSLQSARALAANIKGLRPELKARVEPDATPWVAPRPDERADFFSVRTMSPWRARSGLGPVANKPRAILRYGNAKRLGVKR
jgi:hypothetical protein